MHGNAAGITQQQIDHATRSLRADMAAAQRPPMSYEDVDERPQWWDVSAYVAMLDKMETLQFIHYNKYIL